MVTGNTPSQSKRLFGAIAGIFLLIFALVVALLVLPANEVDRVLRDRDKALFALMVDQSINRVGHTQESSTIWDEALIKLRERPVDSDWLDLNMGVWFNEYAGHDEVYILDGNDAPLYAMRQGERKEPAAYDAVRPVIQPFVDDLRTKKHTEPEMPADLSMLSPGAAGLGIVAGHPAIISAKPVLSDTGNLEQEPDTAPVHVSVVYVDGPFIARLSERYGFSDGRYSSSASVKRKEVAVPLVSPEKEIIGYFIWRPFAPGADVTSYVAPAIMIALGLAGVAILVLTQRLGATAMDLEVSKAQAQHLAMHDVLTGLPNRAMFEHRLDAALAQSKEDGSRLALLYLDLDRFKQVNDSLGHPAGDLLIREVAERLSALVRSYDTVARLGGDEFAIILHDIADTAVITEIGDRIVRDLEEPFDLMGSQTFIGASLGIAMSPDHGTDRTELIRKADIALYKAKMDGRSRYAVFSPALDEAVKMREEIDRDLRNAVIDCEEQLKLHYQPVFSAATGEMTAVEALLRWEHPTRGLTSPAAFISFAEETGLIERIGEWALRTALRDASGWPDIRLSVNVSPVQIRNPAFGGMVMDILRETGIRPERLELEITETALMDRSSGVAQTLERLRNAGVLIALDDFGTGYSSLSHIRDIAVDRIKIDRSFVTAIEKGNGRALIQAIVSLAQANGLRLTAEGVETREQQDFLRQVGCDELQGYLLSHPVTAGEVGGRHSGDNVRVMNRRTGSRAA